MGYLTWETVSASPPVATISVHAAVPPQCGRFGLGNAPRRNRNLAWCVRCRHGRRDRFDLGRGARRAIAMAT
jgi:hypothetical protein